MLAIQPPQGKAPETETDSLTSLNCRCKPNILPCRIHHDGPLESKLERYWNPTEYSDGDTTITSKPSTSNDNQTQMAYFRGRRLKGHRVPVPDGYEGILAIQTNNTLPTSQEPREDDDEEDDDEEEEPVKVLEKTSAFDEFVVWSHERVPVAAEDPFIKGVEEWIRFAEVIHSNSEENQKSENTTTLASRNKIPDEESNSN